ncbi:hypothetical protein [Clostridium formicaceticum]|uniref:Uncharacterized protein n=1 Tax=Clostridium formicaceticum TaxID=1497 RepID=A0AAC9WGS9_9CLOT|nr:hypothetical protein [Clostridium formicaceticum]AOY76566.1 hypothetical protein BJL90_12275 [Clostridium formicaceticum]ARE86985.1 hypothetical protein CLFO_13700 [Clostridium formicaceticum]
MIHDKDIVLETERIYLRYFNEEDFDNLYLLSSNKNVMRFFREILDVARKQNIGVLVVSHEKNLMKRLCHRVIDLAKEQQLVNYHHHL